MGTVDQSVAVTLRIGSDEYSWLSCVGPARGALRTTCGKKVKVWHFNDRGICESCSTKYVRTSIAEARVSADFGRELVRALAEIRAFLGRVSSPRLPRDELEQVVAVRVLERARRGVVPRNLKSYCMTVARRESGRERGAIDRRRGPASDLELVPDRNGCPVEAAVRVEERERVERAMARLIPSRAESLRRLYWQADPLANDNARSRTTSRARRDLLLAVVSENSAGVVC